MAQAATQSVERIPTNEAPRVFNKEQTKALLGNISNATYYRIRKRELLPYSRMFPGGPVVHTETHLRQYIAYLDSNTRGAEVPNGVISFRGPRST